MLFYRNRPSSWASVGLKHDFHLFLLMCLPFFFLYRLSFPFSFSLPRRNVMEEDVVVASILLIVYTHTHTHRAVHTVRVAKKKSSLFDGRSRAEGRKIKMDKRWWKKTEFNHFLGVQREKLNDIWLALFLSTGNSSSRNRPSLCTSNSYKYYLNRWVGVKVICVSVEIAIVT